MKLRRHATSIVLAVLAVAGVAYEWADRGSVSESEKKARASNVFVGWRREDLTRIEVDHPGAEPVVLERTDDDAGGHDWWIRAPGAFAGERADAEAVERLIGVLEFATVARKVDPTLHAPGLDAPRATVTLTMGAVTHRASLGADAPTPAGAAYLREGGATVVVGKELALALLQTVDAYRSRAIVPYLSIALSRLDVKAPGAGFAIVRADDTSFTLVGSGLRASRAKLDGVWSALAELHAESFVDAATAAPLVASPVVDVTMTPSDPSSRPGTLRLGAPCPGHEDDVVVVRDAPTRLSACAPKGAVAGLSVTAASLVDTRLFAAHDDEMNEVRVERVGKPDALELARKEGGWRERAPVERDLEGDAAEAATAFVAALARSEGAEPSKSDAPFAPATRVTVHRAGGVVEVIDVSVPDANGDAVALRKLDGARLTVAASVTRLLTPRAAALRGPDVWTPRLEGARATSLSSACDGVDQVAVERAGSWRLERPTGFDADNGSVTDAIDAIERLRAEAWVADADDGHFGFGACSVSLTVAADGGARTVRVEIGHEGEGGVYARTSEDPAVFVAPTALRDRARAWLVDEHALVPTPPIASVVLEHDGRRVTIAADAGDPDGDDALQEATVLRADDVIHLGPARPDEGFARPLLVATVRGPSGAKRLTLGARRDSDHTVLARVDGVDATFAIDEGRIKGWLARR